MKLNHQSMTSLAMVFIALLLIALAASSASAQTSFSGHSGRAGVMNGTGSRALGSRTTGIRRTPTLRTQTANSQRLSPYLDLLRSDNSVLGPYHSFVLPRQQIQQSIRQQSSEIRNLRRSVSESPNATPSRGRTQTGRGGSFNNHLHYYQFPSSAR